MAEKRPHEILPPGTFCILWPDFFQRDVATRAPGFPKSAYEMIFRRPWPSET